MILKLLVILFLLSKFVFTGVVEIGRGLSSSRLYIVESGDNFINILHKETRLSRDIKYKITRGLEDEKVILYTGDEVRFNHRRDKLEEITISRSDLNMIVIEIEDNVVISKKEEPYNKIYNMIVGEIEQDGTFMGSASRAGVSATAINAYYQLMGHSIDFEREILPGSKFAIFYLELESYDRVKETIVYYMALETDRHKIDFYKYHNGDKGAFYNVDGKGATKTLKKTPLNIPVSISSHFNPNRKHPILGYTRAHKGTDFRARIGTPIPSGGDGIITKRAYGTGYGNYIKIKHNGSYSTVYAHISKFAKYKVGDRVKQGDIIGYVGMTGYATGPHLHYEIHYNGRAVNPMKIVLPSVKNLSKTELEKFNIEKSKYIALIDKMKKGDIKQVIIPNKKWKRQHKGKYNLDIKL
ncbi:MAG: peptidoglycan DD-metalloendopeptidase family protein [Alphaproteobacteria bacterium]|nr:peptidoglycan DD-metalloendopeptidase family protein [Alphaproteobacteria bacterium]